MHRARANGQLDGRDREWLTPEQAEQARRALAAGLTTREVAEQLGIPYRRMRERLIDQLGIRLGRGRVRRGIPKTPFPVLSDQEIRARCAEIRSRWTPERWLEAGCYRPGTGRREPRWPR